MAQPGDVAVQITVDGSSARAGLNQVAGDLDRFGRQAAQAGSGTAALTEQLTRAGQAALALGAIHFSVGGIARASDEFASLNAQLKISTGSLLAGQEAYAETLQIALETGQALGNVGTVYKRFADNSITLGLSQRQVADAARTVAQTIALSGGNAASANAALTQFGQALASGTLRGEELNSVLEQAPRLAKAIADGMNVPVGKLRELAEQGRITSEEIVKALAAQSARIADEFGKMPLTMSRAMTNLQTAFTDQVGSFEKSTGVFQSVAGGIDALARNMDVLAVAGAGVASVMAGRVVSGMAAAASAAAANAAAQRASLQVAESAAIAELRKAQVAQQSAAAELERARSSVAAAQLEIAADRERYASTALIIRQEIELEKVRLAAQINAVGRAQRVAEMAALSRQLAAAEAAESAVATRLTSVRAAQTAATETAAAASARLAAAQAVATSSAAAAAGGAGIASRALGFLGGPVGAVTTALMLGVTAWQLWGSTAKDTTTDAGRAVSENIDHITGKLAEMNGRIEDTSRKAYTAMLGSAESSLKTVQAEIRQREQRLDALDRAGGRGRFSEEGKEIQAQLNKLATQEVQLQGELTIARERSAEVGIGAIRKFVDANATGAEKVRVSQTKALQEFAQSIAQTGGVLDLSNAAHLSAYRALNAELKKITQEGEPFRESKAAADARADALVKSYQSSVKRAIEIIKSQHEQMRLPTQVMIEATAIYESSAIEQQIAALRGKLKAATTQAERIKIGADIGELEAQLQQIPVKTVAAISEAAAKTQDLLGKMAVDAGKALDPLEQKAREFGEKYGKAMQQAAVDGNDAVIEAGRAVWSAWANDAQFSSAKQQYEVLFSQLQAELEDVRLAAERNGGVLAAIDAANKADEIKSRLLPALEVARQKMVEFGDASPVNERTAIEATRALRKVADEGNAYWREFNRDIERSLTDSIYRGAEKGGKDGAKIARDTFLNTFKVAPIKLAVQVAFQPISNAIGQVFGQAGSSGSASGVAGATNSLNLFSAGKNILSSINGTPFASGFDKLAASSWGQSALYAPAQGIQSGGMMLDVLDAGSVGQLTELGGTLKAGAEFLDSYGGYINAAYQLSQGKYGAAVGAAIGQMTPLGPIGSVIGSTIGGMLDSAFSSDGAPKSMIGGGGRITASGVDYNVAGLPHWTDYTAQSQQLASSIVTDQLVTALHKINAGYTGSAYFKGEINSKGSSSNQTLAQATNAAGQVVYHRFVESGKGAEDFQRAAAAEIPKLQLALMVDAMRGAGGEIKGIADSVVGTAGDLTAALSGMDSAAVAATTANLSGLVDALDLLKDTVDARITGDSVSALARAAGGVQNLTAAVAGYYDNYFSEEEKSARLHSQIAETLAAVNLPMPATVAGFAALEKGLDKNTAAGQQAFLTLMSVQGAFKQMSTAGEQAAETARTTAASATDEAMRTLQRAVDVQRKSAQAALQVAQEQVTGLRSIYDSLRSEVAGLQSGAAGRAAEASRFIDSALTAALTSGYLPDQEDLAAAIAAAKDGVEKGIYASEVEQERDRLVLAGKLQQLRDVSGRQLTAAEQQLRAAEDQVSALDAMVAGQQSQIDALRGINGSVLSVADAIAALQGAIGKEQTLSAAQKAALKAPAGGSSAAAIAAAYQSALGRAPDEAGAAYWQNQIAGGASVETVTNAIANSAEAQVANLYESVLGRAGDSGGVSYWTEQVAAGVSIATIAAAMQASDEYRNSHAGGLERVPYDGYKATLHHDEAVVDAQSVRAIQRYFGVTPTAASGNTERLERLVEALTAEVQRLRGVAESSAHESRRTADAVNGNPEQPMIVEIVA